MARSANQPAETDFRQGSTERRLIHTIEQMQFYGLLGYWSREVNRDDKVGYRLVFPDGTSEDGLKPSEAAWMLEGMLTAHRLHTRGLVHDVTKGN